MNQLSGFTRKVLAASVVAASLAVSSLSANAVVLADFTVDEGSVPGTTSQTFPADLINGGYTEVITFTGNTFTSTAFADWGQYFSNDGTSLVAASELNDTYAMYTTFTASGTFACNAVTCTFTGALASVNLFIDPEQDTTKALGATGSDPVTLGNTGDDYLIATADSLVSGEGILLIGTGGFFDLVFDNFTLTADGANYFISPDPFYLHVTVDGDFNTFVVAGTQTISGDLSAVFIPEPGSLALLGIGLLGLGFSLRRKLAA